MLGVVSPLRTLIQTESTPQLPSEEIHEAYFSFFLSLNTSRTYRHDGLLGLGRPRSCMANQKAQFQIPKPRGQAEWRPETSCSNKSGRKNSLIYPTSRITLPIFNLRLRAPNDDPLIGKQVRQQPCECDKTCGYRELHKIRRPGQSELPDSC